MFRMRMTTSLQTNVTKCGVGKCFLGLFLVWCVALPGFGQQAVVSPETALRSYLNNGDPTYAWEIRDSLVYEKGTIFQVLLTSQRWREHTWKHQLNVIVPREVTFDGGLLFISSGRMQKDDPTMPQWHDLATDGLIQDIARIAEENKAVAAVIRQVPNQPLYGGLVEDELISYTLHQFQKDKDFSWPLLFPMVKSAVRGMDAIQELVANRSTKPVHRFVVSGLSKRGWTTWLTASQDDRVEALAPMVIDILNMPVNLNYQIEVWQDYSPQIQDYVALGLVQDIESDRGRTLAQMIDPYSYRKMLNKPKMLFMGTNDPYWVIDAVKHYIDSIPGPYYLHYVPNEGHDLGDKRQAFQALSSFWGHTLQHKPYPVTDYTTSFEKDALELNIRATKPKLAGAVVWSAVSDDSDFRDETWVSRELPVTRKRKFKVKEQLPDSGYKAFYVDLKYRNANGELYTQSTRVFVSDSHSFFLN
jgi:PhoPQ-activated pathogenicity-related protein